MWFTQNESMENMAVNGGNDLGHILYHRLLPIDHVIQVLLFGRLFVDVFN